MTDFEIEERKQELAQRSMRRNAMRRMTWFALFGMLLYPFGVFMTSLFGLDQAAEIVGDIAPTYFVSIAALVASYFGANAYSDRSNKVNKDIE